MSPIKTSIRSTLRALKWFFLITLPLTLIPTLHGLVDGVFFALWTSRQVDINTEAFVSDMQEAASDWSVSPRSTTFRQFEDTNNEFGIMRINTDDWTEKLGYYLPQEISNNPNAAIDSLASLELLVASTENEDSLKDQWVYFTEYGWKGLIWDPWDIAFSTIIKQSFVDPRINNASYFMAACSGTASFLCGMWHARSPALLHFRASDEPIDSRELLDHGYTYPAPDISLRKVTARLISFPLKDTHLRLQRNVFPGYEEQLRVVLSKECIIDQFEPYGPIWEFSPHAMNRYNEHLDERRKTKGSVFAYLDKMDDWILDLVAKPLQIRDSIEWFGNAAFTLTYLIVLPSTNIAQQLRMFFVYGYPDESEPKGEDMGSPEPGSAMESHMVQFLLKQMGKSETEQGHSAVTSGPPTTTYPYFDI